MAIQRLKNLTQTFYKFLVVHLRAHDRLIPSKYYTKRHNVIIL
jgi:hypothetical protein